MATVDGGQVYALNTLTLNATGATLAVDGTLNLGGTQHLLSVQAGTVRADIAAALSGSVDVTLASGATLDVNGNAQTISGLAGAGTVLLERSSSITFGSDISDSSLGGSVTGNDFNNAYLSKTGSGTLTLAGATMILASLSVSAGHLAVATGSTSLTYLAVGEGGGNSADATISGRTVALSYSLNIGNQGGSGVYNLSGGLFHLAQDVGTGTLVTNDSPIPCFLHGSRIATSEGAVAVAALRVGDLVRTCSGEARPIMWIGTGRAVATAGNRCDVAPVIIRAGALADGVPARDLAVKRHHAVLVGDVLVPAQHLVNGRSVVWDDRTGPIEYYHIELQTHDVLMAEGAPVESFRDDCSAELFANAASRATRQVEACRAVVKRGPALEQAWRAIAARLGPVPDDSMTDNAGLHGEVDGIRIAAEPGQDGCIRFRLPAGVSDIAIVSRHGIPAALRLGNDLRRLGGALAGMSVLTEIGRQELVLMEPAKGFHASDEGHRWTNTRRPND